MKNPKKVKIQDFMLKLNRSGKRTEQDIQKSKNFWMAAVGLSVKNPKKVKLPKKIKG